MSAIELTNDEVIALNWFQEFLSSEFVADDETINSLIAKEMLFVAGGGVFLTVNGMKWLNDHSRFFR